MNKTEKLKEIIIKKYGSIRAFSKSINIPSTTLTSALDKGIGGMSVDKVIKICDALNIDIKTFDEIHENKYIYENTNKSNLLNNYEKLNTEGQKKLLDYSYDLKDNPKYSNQILLNAAHYDGLTEEEKSIVENKVQEILKSRKNNI